MFGNAIQASISTVTAGSPDTFTLADVAGAPNFNDVFGSSGTRIVSYTAIEFTDSTRAEIKYMHWGFGSINLSTLVLTQTQIKGAWNPATPAYDITAPAELTFTAGANTTRVYCAPLAETSVGIAFPGTGNLSVVTDNTTGHNTFQTYASSGGSFAVTADREYWRCFYWPGVSQIDRVTVRTGSVTTGNIKYAWYECGPDGLPGQRIKDFGTAAIGGSGVKTQIAVTDFCPPPGWYWECSIFDAAVSVYSMRAGYTSPFGTDLNSASQPIVGYHRTGSYSTGLPSAGVTTSPTAYTGLPAGDTSLPRYQFRMAA